MLGAGAELADLRCVACDVQFSGKTYKALSWGLTASNGSMPAGCFTTVVKKKYDVKVPCSGENL